MSSRQPCWRRGQVVKGILAEVLVTVGARVNRPFSVPKCVMYPHTGILACVLEDIIGEMPKGKPLTLPHSTAWKENQTAWRSCSSRPGGVVGRHVSVWSRASWGFAEKHQILESDPEAHGRLIRSLIGSHILLHPI